MEVGIVLVGLGAMYILSNQGQQKIGSEKRTPLLKTSEFTVSANL